MLRLNFEHPVYRSQYDAYVRRYTLWLAGIFFAIAAACFAGIILSAGCSTNQQTTAYKTESAIDASVVAAWNLWTNYAALSKAPRSQRVSVAAAFNKVKAAELVAISASQVFAGATNSATAISALTAANSAEAQALQDLGNMLAQFNIKL